MLLGSKVINAIFKIFSKGHYRSPLNFTKSQSMFSYATPKVWNSLPLSLREIETLYLFKKCLKAYIQGVSKVTPDF